MDYHQHHHLHELVDTDHPVDSHLADVLGLGNVEQDPLIVI